MFKPERKEMNPERAQKLWPYLVKWERRLKRNVLLCRIIQPLGAVIFTFNMLLAMVNLMLSFGQEAITKAMEKVPLLPSMVESFPREDWKAALVFMGWFGFLIPLLISGLVFVTLLALDIYRYMKKPIPPLNGTEAECAAALAHEAEWVYGLRKKMPRWSVFLETTILTALTAWPILSVCLRYLGGDEPAPLQIALACFAMLVCLFVVFWFFALCFWIFANLNALYYISPSEWKLWTLFNDLDDYWESVDPQEYERRERVAEQRFLRRKKNREMR